jgi:succinoglycan biosynthesis transport protein ExoP
LLKPQRNIVKQLVTIKSEEFSPHAVCSDNCKKTRIMTGDISFTIIDVLRGMVRRKLLVMSCTALGLMAGLGVVTVFKPSYQAESRVLVQNLATPYDQANVNQATPRDGTIDERVIKSQMAVVESSDLSLRVVNQLRLAELSEFDSLKKPLGSVSRLLIAAGFSDDPRPMTAEQRALRRIADKRTVYAVPESNVIAIKYVAQDGKVAADVANALAETYVISTRESDAGSNSRARDWLSGQIEELRARVSSSDAAVEKFRAEKGLFRSRETTIGSQEISELNSQMTLADAAQSEAQAKADEIRNLLATKGSVDASSEVLNSPTIQRLRELQVNAARKVSELSATYLPNHPKMKAAQKDVDNLGKQVRREALKIVDGLQGQAKVAAARADSLRASLEVLKGRETISLQDEVRLKELEREAKANRDQLELMLARFADSNTRQNLDMQPGTARVIQYASAPANPYFPKFGPTLLLTTMIGLGLGLGLAFLLEIMRQAARLNAPSLAHALDPQAARRHPLLATEADRKIPDFVVPSAQAPVTRAASKVVVPQATLPHAGAPGKSASVVTSIPSARSTAEASLLLGLVEPDKTHSALLTPLAERTIALLRKGGNNAVAVTGMGTGHEMAAAALALSRKLSAEGLKTILLDLDCRHTIIPDLMQLPSVQGLTDLLAGQADFAAIMQRDASTQLQVIRCGKVQPDSAAFLAQRMENITRTLAGIYDAVIVHVGEASPQSLRLMQGCGAAIIFASAERMGALAPAVQTLTARGVADVLAVRIDSALKLAA